MYLLKRLIDNLTTRKDRKEFAKKRFANLKEYEKELDRLNGDRDVLIKYEMEIYGMEKEGYDISKPKEIAESWREKLKKRKILEKIDFRE